MTRLTRASSLVGGGARKTVVDRHAGSSIQMFIGIGKHGFVYLGSHPSF
jgi:hypothetical protein